MKKIIIIIFGIYMIPFISIKLVSFIVCVIQTLPFAIFGRFNQWIDFIQDEWTRTSDYF